MRIQKIHQNILYSILPTLHEVQKEKQKNITRYEELTQHMIGTHLRKVNQQPWINLITFLLTISRTLELSFQSSFHLSLTVLVCYRFPRYIEP